MRSVMALILIWIELLRPSHHHDQRPQRMQHFDRRTLRREHVRQAAIDMRTLVRPATAQQHALLLYPLIHHLARDRARLQHLTSARALARRRGPTHDPTGTVHG